MKLNELELGKNTKVTHVLFYEGIADMVGYFFYKIKEDNGRRERILSIAKPDNQEIILKHLDEMEEEDKVYRYDYFERHKTSDYVEYDFIYNLANSDYKKIVFETSAELGYLECGFWESRVEALMWRYESFSALSEKEYCRSTVKRMQQRLDEIKQAAEEGQLLVLWTSKNEKDLCGLYYLMTQLKDIDCEIVWMKLPEQPLDTNGNVIEDDIHFWGEVPPEELAVSMSEAKVLEAADKLQLAAEWERLAAENGEMRVYENGKIKSVSIKYYDALIEKYVAAEPDEFLVTSVIGALLQDRTTTVNDGVWTRRIFQMIGEGKLEYIRPYGDYSQKSDCIVRKCKDFGEAGHDCANEG